MAIELPDWFVDAGLAIFVHWDHASQQGIELSWPLVGRSIHPGQEEAEDRVSVREYLDSAATFDPKSWDPAALARLARDAGASYVVLTTRHHAGYSMFHTDHSTFGVRESPYQGDITREFADAVRAEGLRVGFYYSLPDWRHPDYPAFRDEDRPYVFGEYPRATPEQWARYQDYLRGQLGELLTNYGRVDLLWFDGEWERTADEWQARELRAYLKNLAPDIVVNDRLPGNGDYVTPEQGLPSRIPDGPWELCLTMNESWGWRPADVQYKSARQLVEYLAVVVSRGGRLLLNVSPTGNGSLPEAQVGILRQFAEWNREHGEAVTGVRPGDPRVDYYGPVTQRPGRMYLHLISRPVERVSARGLPVERIRSVSLLGTGATLPYTVSIDVRQHAGPGEDRLGELDIAAPQPSGALMDVIAIDLD